MEITNFLLFAAIGAIILVVVTGGIVSMSDETPSPGALGGGAIVGAGMGITAAYFLGPDESSKLMNQIGGGRSDPQMKIGLPNF